MSISKPEFLAVLNELEEAAFQKGYRAAQYSNFLVNSDRYRQNVSEFNQFSTDLTNAKRELTDLIFAK